MQTCACGAQRFHSTALQTGPSGIFKTFFACLVLNVGVFLMLKLVLGYTSFDDNVGFLREKQAYLHLPVWKAAFYIHVFTSILTLLAGFTQFSTGLLARHRRLHRILGRVYVFNILCINFPAGLVMAVYANGHLPSKIAFTLLDSLWFWFTLKAVLEARRGRIQQHSDYMLRSYALTLSALTLRTWNIVLINTTSLSPEVIYMMNAWLGFVPNWLCAEWLIWRRRRRSSSKKYAKDHNHAHGEDGKTNDESHDAARPAPLASKFHARGDPH